MGKSKKYGTLFIILLVCFFASLVAIAIFSEDGEPNTPLVNILVGCLLLSLALAIFVIILFIKEKRKTGRNEQKDFEHAKQKQSLEIKKEDLEIERDHTDKSNFRICGRCGSRVPTSDVRCQSCGG